MKHKASCCGTTFFYECEADQNKCPIEFAGIRIQRKELAALITMELNLGNGKICVA